MNDFLSIGNIDFLELDTENENPLQHKNTMMTTGYSCC